MGQPVMKKHKSPSALRDLSVTEAGKYGTLNDFAFFDRIRKTIPNPDVYRNFLRCLVIYNNEIINETELLQLTTPFLTPHPELLRWFKEFLGPTDTLYSCSNRDYSKDTESKRESQHSFLDQVHNNVVRPENSIDIDFSQCKRIGASYCAVPDEFNSPKCSGRTDLCREVLNDNWVSFPSWSEDSTFVSSHKTQYEEYIYRCEDERFELDVVIETNAATIKVRFLARKSHLILYEIRCANCGNFRALTPCHRCRSRKCLPGSWRPISLEFVAASPAGSKDGLGPGT